jgi:hypothetical protein
MGFGSQPVFGFKISGMDYEQRNEFLKEQKKIHFNDEFRIKHEVIKKIVKYHDEVYSLNFWNEIIDEVIEDDSTELGNGSSVYEMYAYLFWLSLFNPDIEIETEIGDGDYALIYLTIKNGKIIDFKRNIECMKDNMDVEEYFDYSDDYLRDEFSGDWYDDKRKFIAPIGRKVSFVFNKFFKK